MLAASYSWWTPMKLLNDVSMLYSLLPLSIRSDDILKAAVTNTVEPEKRLTATEIKLRELRAAAEFNIMGGVLDRDLRRYYWNERMVKATNPQVAERFRVIRDWELAGRIETVRDYDLCVGHSRITVKVTTLKGAVFTEPEVQFPSEGLFARLALALEVAPRPDKSGSSYYAGNPK